MCGIVGINAKTEFYVTEAIKRLKRLEYRGYDSFGYYDGNKLKKEIGHISIPKTKDKTKIIISHTRWATHGGVTDKNAHPHQSCDKKITIVHNGFINNYYELRNELKKKGHVFLSETDTEIIPHYFEEKLKTVDIKQACIDFIKDIKGEFAILVYVDGDENIYALRRDSPLVLGIGEDENILASDIYAFSDITNKAIFFENNEFAIVSNKNYF